MILSIIQNPSVPTLVKKNIRTLRHHVLLAPQLTHRRVIEVVPLSTLRVPNIPSHVLRVGSVVSAPRTPKVVAYRHQVVENRSLHVHFGVTLEIVIWKFRVA